jgi:hypothetical protein
MKPRTTQDDLYEAAENVNAAGLRYLGAWDRGKGVMVVADDSSMGEDALEIPLQDCSDVSKIEERRAIARSEARLALFGRVYDSFKDKFTEGFHTMLWHVVVNGAFKKSRCAFTEIVGHGYWTLGIAEEGIPGYTPTNVEFRVKEYDVIHAITCRLNRATFGIDEKTAIQIVFTTMGGK